MKRTFSKSKELEYILLKSSNIKILESKFARGLNPLSHLSIKSELNPITTAEAVNTREGGHHAAAAAGVHQVVVEARVVGEHGKGPPALFVVGAQRGGKVRK